jgi:hypothetical protein
MGTDSKGRTFFIDHNTKTTTWEDPRGSKASFRKSLEPTGVAHKTHLKRASDLSGVTLPPDFAMPIPPPLTSEVAPVEYGHRP